MAFRKIINDPVYGFITIDDPLIFRIISHPWYQRLRRISQMALSYLVYPGAMHSRLHHSLGAYHLMGLAVAELRSKGTEITGEEERAVKIAILLHDIGHGPFSHALESVLIEDLDHEEISVLLMDKLNEQFDGALSMAIEIFRGGYPKKFLHQLITGQLDVDRMDYLTRDSFFTGVVEGTVGYDRLIKMLVVHEGQLMVEEKGIYSIEKFLVARRIMYWQVYLHKTVLSAEMTLVKILQRVKALALTAPELIPASDPLQNFLLKQYPGTIKQHIELFCALDDTDVISAVKKWSRSPDHVLALLCRTVLDRRLFKLELQPTPVAAEIVKARRQELALQLDIPEEDAAFLVFTGEAVNTLYDPYDDRINILYRNGTVRDISVVDDALIQQNMSHPVKKFYICYHKPPASPNHAAGAAGNP
jgi:HD superfamily phosphohydrolase